LTKSRVVARRQCDLNERNKQDEEIDEIWKGKEVSIKLNVEFEREFNQINWKEKVDVGIFKPFFVVEIVRVRQFY